MAHWLADQPVLVRGKSVTQGPCNRFIYDRMAQRPAVLEHLIFVFLGVLDVESRLKPSKLHELDLRGRQSPLHNWTEWRAGPVGALSRRSSSINPTLLKPKAPRSPCRCASERHGDLRNSVLSIAMKVHFLILDLRLRGARNSATNTISESGDCSGTSFRISRREASWGRPLLRRHPFCADDRGAMPPFVSELNLLRGTAFPIYYRQHWADYGPAARNL